MFTSLRGAIRSFERGAGALTRGLPTSLGLPIWVRPPLPGKLPPEPREADCGRIWGVLPRPFSGPWPDLDILGREPLSVRFIPPRGSILVFEPPALGGRGTDRGEIAPRSGIRILLFGFATGAPPRFDTLGVGRCAPGFPIADAGRSIPPFRACDVGR
jgi:hypothetical protein